MFRTITKNSCNGTATARNVSKGAGGLHQSTSQRQSLEESRQALEIGGLLQSWPRDKANTILNVCPQGEEHVVERFGQLYDIRKAGLYFTLPLIDKIRYRVDMREKALAIDSQTCITKDNVSTQVSGVVYASFFNARLAAYGHYNPLFAVMQHAKSMMRATVGQVELDQLFHDRDYVNSKITNAICEASSKWGLTVLRYEITDITPDRHIAEAMDKQAAAERYRREKVLKAQGEKEAAVLTSEGLLIARTNEAEATRRELEAHAQGQAKAMHLEATAQKLAIESVSKALSGKMGVEAARLALGEKYIGMMGEIGSKSNTIFFGEQAGDMSGMMARIGTALQAVSKTSDNTDQNAARDSQ